MRIMAIVEYDGSNYCGFQIQPNAISIQQVLETAMSKLLKQDIKVVPSGRTDTGVHAYGQVIHFDLEGDFDLNKLPFALNAILPSDVAVLYAQECAVDFHARYSAVEKTYEYKILCSKINRPLYKDKYYICPYCLDIDVMKAAAAQLVGEHDFIAFMSTGSSVHETVRLISSLNILTVGEEIIIDITANGFLYNMVRIIVGTLIDIARGRLQLDILTKMLNGGDRNIGGATAPSCGLYLKSVDYRQK